MAAFSIGLRLEGRPSIELCRALLDLAVESNRQWAVRELAAGREVPCCLDCSGLCYAPDAPALSITIHTGEALLSRGVASCGEVAALWLGIERARRWQRVGVVEVVPQRRNVLHAIVALDNGTIYDPTTELKRCRHAR